MNAQLPMDLHSHSEHSHDANYTVKKMCEAAIEKNIAIFAITDHYDISDFDLSFAAFDASLKQSVAHIRAAQSLFRDDLTLLMGIELGQPLERLPKAEEILGAYPFDFVLGSLHNAPARQDIYYYDPADERYDLDRELEAYFIHLLDTVHWGRFDSAAHITYPFRYIIERQQNPYSFHRWDDYLETIVKAIAEQGLALELNVSGLRKKAAYTMPDMRWVKRFRELGGEKLTLGADAHSPAAVGGGIAEGLMIAGKAGFQHLCYFVRREPRFVRITD